MSVPQRKTPNDVPKLNSSFLASMCSKFFVNYFQFF